MEFKKLECENKKSFAKDAQSKQRHGKRDGFFNSQGELN